MKFVYTSTIYLTQTLSLNVSLHLPTPLLLVEIRRHLLPFMIQILKDTNLNQKCKLTKRAVHVIELEFSNKVQCDFTLPEFLQLVHEVSSLPEVLYKKDIVKNFAKFKGKHLCSTVLLISRQPEALKHCPQKCD